MYSTLGKILNRDQLSAKLEIWRFKELSIVFTNGCFDLLHLGHVDYLEKARNLGDVLVVGLNSDQSVRRLKGPNRPILDEYARARILGALEFVTAVVVFEEDTPYELIKLVQPKILVKGGDYENKEIVGSDLVIPNGKVETIPLVEGYATTNLVEKIRNHHKHE